MTEKKKKKLWETKSLNSEFIIIRHEVKRHYECNFSWPFILKEVWDLTCIFWNLFPEELSFHNKLQTQLCLVSVRFGVKKGKGYMGFKFSKLDVYVILLNFWSENSGINDILKRSKMGLR